VRVSRIHFVHACAVNGGLSGAKTYTYLNLTRKLRNLQNSFSRYSGWPLWTNTLNNTIGKRTHALVKNTCVTKNISLLIYFMRTHFFSNNFRSNFTILYILHCTHTNYTTRSPCQSRLRPLYGLAYRKQQNNVNLFFSILYYTCTGKFSFRNWKRLRFIPIFLRVKHSSELFRSRVHRRCGLSHRSLSHRGRSLCNVSSPSVVARTLARLEQGRTIEGEHQREIVLTTFNALPLLQQLITAALLLSTSNRYNTSGSLAKF